MWITQYPWDVINLTFEYKSTFNLFFRDMDLRTAEDGRMVSIMHWNLNEFSLHRDTICKLGDG